MTSSMFYRAAGVGVFFLLVVGCEQVSENPVIFGQATTVGISVGQSPTTQVPELVLGYKDANIAFLPTTAEDGQGNMRILGGQSGAHPNIFAETYSVIGQFEVTASANPLAGLGKFFATGLAAQKLSSGFACAVSKGKDSAHCHPNSSGD